MRKWIVTGTSMVTEAETAEEAIERAEQSSGWHWEATEQDDPNEPNEYGLVGMQRERYDALMEQVGDHDAALKDARKWPADKTWTFVGHWENDRIVVEYIRPGEVVDDRDDTGFWEQGLWAASGTGATVEEAEANVIAEYEAPLHPDDDDDEEN